MNLPTRPIPVRSVKRWEPTMARVSVVFCAVVFLLAGCSSTKHYKLLSFFFDGVPDPNAPSPTAAAGGRTIIGPGGQVITVVSYVHQPYRENKCNSCHVATGENFDDFKPMDSRVCLKCHEKEKNKYPVMHGPVAVAACLMCHAPHESTVRGMLKEPSPQVCVQCHFGLFLPTKPPEHLDPVKSCLDCHVGHGGNEHGLLRNQVASTQPTTAPAARGVGS